MLKLVPWIACGVVLPIQFVRMILWGFRHTHSGLGDGRLVNYALEHGYLWLGRSPLHRDFWNVPLFHPQEGVSAYTDFLLGHGIPYWIWRFAGAAPDTALQLWILTIFALNFAAGYALLRRGLRLGTLASTAGALLVMVASVRWLEHLQLVPLYYVLIAILALIRIFDGHETTVTRKQRRLWIAIFLGACVLQAWSAVYPFFFFGLSAGFALLATLAFRRPRRLLLTSLSRDIGWWGSCTAIAATAMTPLVLRYLSVAHELGYRAYDATAIARPIDWLLLGSKHWFYGRWSPTVAAGTPEPMAGAGPLALVVAVVGIALARRRTTVQLLAIATLAFAIVATRYGSFSPWQFVHEYVPGAGGIRAPNRALMVLTPLLAIGVATAVDHAIRNRRWLIAAALALACIGERASKIAYTDKILVRAHVESIASRIDPACEAFFLVGTSPDGQWIAEDAAWAGLAAGKPTINGRYGNAPSGYDLGATPLIGESLGDRVRLEDSLRAWAQRNGIEREKIQWIEYTPLSRAWVRKVRSGALEFE